MKQVRGIKVVLQDIIDSNPANTMFNDWIVPVKATILAGRSGTLVQSAEGGYYLVPVGDWFRSGYSGLPQVEDFNTLQDYGMTEIKDGVIRNGQEIRGKDNVSVEKVDEAVASDSSEEKVD